MDLTKFFLYTALAIVTYLMLLAWQEDYPPLVQGESSIASLPTTAPPTDTPLNIPDQLPQQNVPQQNVPQQFVPEQNVPQQDADPVATIATPAQNSSSNTSGAERTVNVETDTLRLTISLDGGDIIALSLPQYLKQLDENSDPFEILEFEPGRQYLAQSGLIGRDGIDSSGRASYQAAASSFSLEDSENSLRVDLVHQTESGVTVTKRFNFNRDSYLIDVSFIVDNQSSAPWQANPFGQIKRDAFDDPSNAGGFGRTYLGFVTTSSDDPYIEIEFEDIDDGTTTFDMLGGWIGFSQHYFLTAWIPDPQATNRYTTRRSNNQYYGEFTGSALLANPGETSEATVQFYAGPKDQYALGDISPNLNLTIDYSFLYFIAAPIYWLLTRINSVFGNYGVSIVLLTVFVKALLYKLSKHNTSPWQACAG